MYQIAVYKDNIVHCRWTSELSSRLDSKRGISEIVFYHERIENIPVTTIK